MTVTPAIPRTPLLPTPKLATKSTEKSARKTPRPALTSGEIEAKARAKAIADAELACERELNTNRLRLSWELIFEKYSKDFDGIADEVDPLTGEVVVDNGHLRGLQDESEKGDEDEDVFLWGQFLGPEKPRKKNKNKRKHGPGDDYAQASRVLGDLAHTMPALSPKRRRQESPKPLQSQLPSDDFVLAQLGSYGPAVLKALHESGVRAGGSPLPATTPTIDPPSPASLGTHPAPSPVTATTPLASSPSNQQAGKRTDSTSKPSSSVPRKKKRKYMVITIPDDEMDELASPDSPCVATPRHKAFSPKVVIPLMAQNSTPIRKSKERVSRPPTSVSAEEEDELQSTSAPTPTKAFTPIRTLFKRPSISTPSALNLERAHTTPRSVPAFKSKPATGGTWITDMGPPKTPNLWAIPRQDDPFYNPVWNDEHPDGTPTQFPPPVVDPMFALPTTPLFAKSPTVRALRGVGLDTPRRRNSAGGTPGKGRRNSMHGTLAKKKEPLTPGWTRTPVRRGSGMLDFFEEIARTKETGKKVEEPSQRSSITVEVPAQPQSGFPTPAQKSATTAPLPPANSRSGSPPQRQSPPNNCVEFTTDSDAEITGVRKAQGKCGDKGVRCEKLCYRCLWASADELLV